MPLENNTNFYGHLVPNAARNRDLIDCYLSGQISERNWTQHLVEEPGLRDAWDFLMRGGRRPTYGLDEKISRLDQIAHDQTRAKIKRWQERKTVEDIAVAQRKLSPRFPTIAEALERRTALRETITARTLLFGGAAGLVYGIGWDSFGYVVAGMSLVGFTIMCFIAGNRQHIRSGGNTNGSRSGPF